MTDEATTRHFTSKGKRCDGSCDFAQDDGRDNDKAFHLKEEKE
jgi:hypothetical protein